MKYVYELIKDGQVIYVGETKNPAIRLYQHTKKVGGKFYGQDLDINVVAGPMSARKALDLEGELKQKYGLEWGERHTRPHQRKLTADQVNHIRKEIMSAKEYAKLYNIAFTTIRSIQRYKTYKEV